MSTFEVGDRVRVVNNASGRQDFTGRTGTVVDPHDDGEVYVNVDNEDIRLLFRPDELTKIDTDAEALDKIAEVFAEWYADDKSTGQAMSALLDILRETGRLS